MELKDVILSTLAEMDENLPDLQPAKAHGEAAASVPQEAVPAKALRADPETADTMADETRYLESVKERLLVLFEGFQSPNNAHIEAKIDLTLNFLEYLLSTIDARIENLKKSKQL